MIEISAVINCYRFPVPCIQRRSQSANKNHTDSPNYRSHSTFCYRVVKLHISTQYLHFINLPEKCRPFLAPRLVTPGSINSCQVSGLIVFANIKVNMFWHYFWCILLPLKKNNVFYLLLHLNSIKSSLRKQPTFRDPNTGFPAKWRLRNERRNSILMTCH